MERKMMMPIQKVDLDNMVNLKVALIMTINKGLLNNLVSYNKLKNMLLNSGHYRLE